MAFIGRTLRRYLPNEELEEDCPEEDVRCSFEEFSNDPFVISYASTHELEKKFRN